MVIEMVKLRVERFYLRALKDSIQLCFRLLEALAAFLVTPQRGL
jgi:hypothetical protein